MKLAIDSYCYHRYFGEVYPDLQQPPARRMTVWDFLRRARQLGVEGVSLESVFLPVDDAAFMDRLRDELDAHNLDRVWAWGHPNGLCSGTDRAAARDLVKHLGIARRFGARVMRIVGGSRRTRPERWSVHRRQLTRMLRPLVDAAENHGIVLAIENHIDLLAAELIELLNEINSPWLGVCLDTGNNLRLCEDPTAAARELAPWARATHIKDIGTLRGDPREFAFWPSVPLGKGLIDLPAVIDALRQTNYQGLLAIEVDFLHPDHGTEDRAVAHSVRYLWSLVEMKPPARRTRSNRG
jgi:sugar phosphate isomerase/epimerase